MRLTSRGWFVLLIILSLVYLVSNPRDEIGMRVYIVSGFLSVGCMLMTVIESEREHG